MSQQQRIPMYVSFASIIKHPEFGRRPSTKIEEQFWYIIHKNKEFLCVNDEFNATIGSNSMSVSLNTGQSIIKHPGFGRRLSTKIDFRQ